MLQAGTDEKLACLMHRDDNLELMAVVDALEARGGRSITSRTFPSFMATRVRSLLGIRLDREQRQLRLDRLGQDTTAHYGIADPEYLREAAATDQVIREIDRNPNRDLWPKPVG